MLRLTALLRRNPALTAEEFQAHWRDVHGPLIRSVPGIERWVVRYEQHPPAALPAGAWGGTDDVDGVTVQWFRSYDDFLAMVSDPAYREIVGPDERYLVDLERSVYLLTDDPEGTRVVIDGAV
ncbi:MAG TPA: EthD domain-containing protein [Acidimicrobiales bacterium]